MIYPAQPELNPAGIAPEARLARNVDAARFAFGRAAKYEIFAVLAAEAELHDRTRRSVHIDLAPCHRMRAPCLVCRMICGSML